MAKERTDVPELLHMRDMDNGLDFLREALGVPLHGVMEAVQRPRSAPSTANVLLIASPRNGYRTRA